MKSPSKVLFQILILFVVFSSAFSGSFFDADHPGFLYTGRIDFTDPKAPKLFWPGTTIQANFEGTSLSVRLNDKNGNSFYNCFVDGDYSAPHVIECRPGEVNYVIATTLSEGEHSLTLFRRTETSTGPTTFLGIELDETRSLLDPPQRPSRRIEFYGNSITCGMGNEAPDDAGDDIMAEENNFLAYGAITARQLDAEYVCIAKSGIGIITSWFDLVMPDYFHRLNPDDTESRWDFTQYRPDVIVVNLFQNDSWLIGNLDPVPNTEQIVDAYVQFIRQIRAQHPESLIVCSLGSMDATRSGSKWPGYIEQAVERMKIEQADTNLTTFFFPFKNWYKHPRVRHHEDMANDLTQFIGQKMGWIEESSIRSQSKHGHIPATHFLYPNYPNPFNPNTQIQYGLTVESPVEIVIFDSRGRQIRTLVNGVRAQGHHSIAWDGEDASGRSMQSGVYLCQMKTPVEVSTRKLILMH